MWLWLCRICRVWILDFLLCCSVLIPFVAARLGLIPPYGGTFHCSDPSLEFPYTGDTVSIKILVILITVPVAVLIFTSELSHSPSSSLSDRLICTTKRTLVLLSRYLVGLLGTACINLAMKTMLAMPRPHFIATCGPDWENINCQENRGNVNFNLSLCLNSENGSNYRDIYDAMKSFPSGHAQLSWFTAVVAMVYIHQRVGTTYSSLWRYWLQLVCFVSAAFISTSRLHDHRHHVQDVVAGALLGTLLGMLTIRTIVTDNSDDSETKRETAASKKEKRPSQMRLIHPEYSYGAVVEAERSSRDASLNMNPGC